MPFTPLHLGPALLVALLLYPFLDVPTLLIASIILDLEPLLIILLKLPQPLHGVYHSITVSTLVAFSLTLVMFLARRYTENLSIKLRLPQSMDIKKYLAASILGTWGHVLLDGFLYEDLSFFYPYEWNPVFQMLSYDQILKICIISVPLAFIIYLLRITIQDWRAKKASQNPTSYEQPSQQETEIKPIEPREEPPRTEHMNEELSTFTYGFNEPEETPPTITETDPYPFDEEPDAAPISAYEGELPEIFLGSDDTPIQWGTIGKSDGVDVAVDLNEPHIVFVCGKQGSGKGYSIGVLIEMLLSMSIKGISHVRKPATIIVFHKPREDMRSEFWSIIEANRNQAEIKLLQEEYNVDPTQLITEKKLRIFIDPFVYKNEAKKFEDDYGTKAYPIGINPTRLTAEDWPHVLSLGKKSGSMYVKKIFQIIKKTQYEPDFGLHTIRREVDKSDLNPNQKSFAMMRLETLQDYLEAEDFVENLVMNGVNIFDLRKIMMEPDDIFSVMMLVISSLLNNERTKRDQFVFVINEAHDYLRKGLSKDFTDYINYMIRKKRHAGTWLMLDTHFPEDVDSKVIKGSDIKIFHKSDILSSNILKQIVNGTSILPHQLKTGQAIIRADKSNLGPDKLLIVNIRPRLTHHGGATKTAL